MSASSGRHRYHDVGALHYGREGVSPVEASGGAADESGESGDVAASSSLPFLLEEAVSLTFADHRFHLTTPGLYRFWDWGEVEEIDGGIAPRASEAAPVGGFDSVVLHGGDLHAVLVALSVLQVHSARHNDCDDEDLLERARRGNIAVTCGRMADFGCRLLGRLGYATRSIRLWRVEGDYNSYDNEHHVFEVRWPDAASDPAGWVLVDLDLGRLFVAGTAAVDGAAPDNLAGMAELNRCVVAGEPFRAVPLSPISTRIDTSGAVEGRSPEYEMFAHTFADEDRLHEWYRRVFAVPAIQEDSEWVTAVEGADAERILRYDQSRGETFTRTVLSRDEWSSRYYGDE